eukprot:TRINITY_DN16962_c0_g1_i1.p1 TRINITY_DN16962_c0_g1~~TRINITY_DN16962_c0_g1_i1.p1  ORF type:complete len:280 (+),score=63.01 TRINITY_DN16962_c0_g1_i1:122-961(+)
MSADFCLFVGDLAGDVDDIHLCNFFAQYYPSCRMGNVMKDPATGQTYGYGIVRFMEVTERASALQAMHGQLLHGDPIRVGGAPGKATDTDAHQWAASVVQQAQQTAQESACGGGMSSEILTVFVGNLGPGISEDELRQHFSYFGEVVSCRIPGDQQRPCGFVEYYSKTAAEQAIAHMNGQEMGGRRLRCEWGKSRPNTSLQYEWMVQAQMMQAQMMQAQMMAQQAAHAAAVAAQGPIVDSTKPYDLRTHNAWYADHQFRKMLPSSHSRAGWGMERKSVF